MLLKKYSIALLLLITIQTPTFADHGPLTTGAGATLIEPETLKQQSLAISAALVTNQYERFSDVYLQEQTQKLGTRGAHVDALKQSLLATTTLAMGILDTLELGLRLRYYRGEMVREGLIDSGGTYRLLKLGDIGGMADPDFYAKYRFWKSASQVFSVAGFVKAPLGKYYSASEAKPLTNYSQALTPRQHLTGGGAVGDPLSEKYAIEPSLTPGSGAWDFSGALAYSYWLGELTSLTASLLYTRRTAAEGYKVGDSFDLGASIQRRFGNRDEANFSLFMELTARQQWSSIAYSEVITNTGGMLLFLSPGYVFAWPSGVSISVFIQLPVLRYLREPQQYLDYRVGFWVAYIFNAR